MQKRRLAGIILLVLGLFFMLNSKANITGAVIGASIFSSKLGFMLGFSFLLVSVILMIVKDNEEARSLEDIAQDTFSKEPEKEKRALLLDTSFIREYSGDLSKLKDFLKQYDKIFVPKEILNEIKNYNAQRLIKEKSREIKGYEKYMKMSTKILEQTEKPQLYKILHPYVEGVLYGTTKSLSKEELRLIQEKTARLRKLAEEENLDISGTFKESLRKTNEYLENHCKVSEGDAAVLASALKGASKHMHALICERDIDLRQAVDLIKKGKIEVGKNIYTTPLKLSIKKAHPKIGAQMDYFEPYVHAD
jgi:rRNA-processing protein FCF1